MISGPRRDWLTAASGAVVLCAALIAGGLLYAAWGDTARDTLVSQTLVNVIIVMGLQVFIGNTGILSFGHMGFAAIAGYTVAILAVPLLLKSRLLARAPWGLADVELHPFWATVVGVGVAMVAGLLVGVALTRSGARSGATSAAMITLAFLFVVHAVAVNWTELTAGGGGLSFGPGGRMDGRGWIYLALVLAVVTARLFALTRTGRFAQAAREDDLAARAVGIEPARPQLVALLLSVALVAVGASLRVQLLGSITPVYFYFDFALLTLVMLIVGGRRSVTGAALGVVVITAGTELTRSITEGSEVPGTGWLLKPGLSDLFLGGAMVGFMLWRPNGVLGDRELDGWFRRRIADPGGPAPQPAAGPADSAGPVGSAAPSPSTLAVEDVSVSFGGFQALAGVSLRATGDEIVGLIGPNGAGKTTLLNVITGLVPADAGVVALDDDDLTHRSSAHIARAGLARTFQNLRLFDDLPVRENVAIAALAAGRSGDGLAAVDVDDLVASAGLWPARHRRARELDYGSQRRLELARAAATGPAFLLLDEPTSGMSDAESASMIHHVRAVAARVGAGVIVIDHDLHFITGICDRIYVLDHGQLLAHGTTAEIRRDPRVIAAYLGPSAAGDAAPS